MINPLYNEVPGYIKNQTWKTIAIHDEENIKGFFGDYKFLSNMTTCTVEFNGHIFDSVENAYQSAKFTHIPGLFVQFLMCSPYESKKIANKNKGLEIENWTEIKRNIMLDLSRQKYSDKNPDLKKLLISTVNKYLEETNWWTDSYWGVYKGIGENHLGKILMEIRKEVIK